MRSRLVLTFLGIVLVLSSAVAEEGGGADEAAPAVDPAALAELPHWPIGALLPDALYEQVRNKKKNRRRRTEKAELLVWIPPETEVVRSVFFIAPNTDSKHIGEHAAVREVAKRHGMAVVYPRKAFHWILGNGPAGGATPALFDHIAELTGRPEFAHVPWIPLGKSSMGLHPTNHAWAYPERTIACIVYHGQTPNWPLPDWAGPDGTDAGAHSILYTCINGHTEWMGTWYRHVRPMLLNYREHHAWLPHQVVLRGIGHGNYQDAHGSRGWGKPVDPGAISCLRVWDYIAVCIDRALTLRVPADADPRQGPVKLTQIDPATGQALHPRAAAVIAGFKQRPLRREGDRYVIVHHEKEPHEVYEPEPQAVPAEQLLVPVSELSEQEARARFWLADEEWYAAWKKLHTPPE